MPIPNKTISAEGAGIFLPGMKVTSPHRKGESGICVVPSLVALDGIPRYDAVYVCWPNGDAEWVYPNMLKRI